jgi:mRNA interferase HigB
VILNGRDLIDAFKKKHARSRKSLDSWVRTAVAATFSSVDPAGAAVVFDIAGNNYRLVAKVNYVVGVIEVTHVMTHAEYDEMNW